MEGADWLQQVLDNVFAQRVASVEAVPIRRLEVDAAINAAPADFLRGLRETVVAANRAGHAVGCDFEVHGIGSEELRKHRSCDTTERGMPGDVFRESRRNQKRPPFSIFLSVPVAIVVGLPDRGDGCHRL